MRLLFILLVPWLALSQDLVEKHWIKWNGEWTTPAQREFADWSYEYGSKQGRGHTLLWLGYSETSWAVSDSGKSQGPFQMDSTTAMWVSEKMGLGILAKDVRAVLENDRATAADMAIWYFNYWYDWHLTRLGPGTRHQSLAWARAVKSYRKGYRGDEVSDDLILFASAWIRFFKTHY